MSNYRNLNITDAPFKLGGSGSLAAFTAVAPGSVNGEVIKAVGPSGNPWPIGVTQEAASPGQEVPVRVIGFTKAIVEANACTLRFGAWLQCASDGQLEPLATEGNGTVGAPLSTSPVFGRYMDSGTVSSGSAIAQVYLFSLPIATCGVLGAS